MFVCPLLSSGVLQSFAKCGTVVCVLTCTVHGELMPESIPEEVSGSGKTAAVFASLGTDSHHHLRLCLPKGNGTQFIKFRNRHLHSYQTVTIEEVL